MLNLLTILTKRHQKWEADVNIKLSAEALRQSNDCDAGVVRDAFVMRHPPASRSRGGQAPHVVAAIG